MDLQCASTERTATTSHPPAVRARLCRASAQTNSYGGDASTLEEIGDLHSHTAHLSVILEGGELAAMVGTYDLGTVLLSYAIASLSGFAAFEFIRHARESSRKLLWTLLSGLVLGLGIWSMHFVGMLAWVPPFPLFYSVDRTIILLWQPSPLQLWRCAWVPPPGSLQVFGSPLDQYP